MEALAKVALNSRKNIFSRESIFADAQTKFSKALQFCRGDHTQDIYQELIHNNNNLRPDELNSLFSSCGLKNICLISCNDDALKELLGEETAERAHAILLERINNFFDRRNQVAHSISASNSSGPNQILNDIGLLKNLSSALTIAVKNQ